MKNSKLLLSFLVTLGLLMTACGQQTSESKEPSIPNDSSSEKEESSQVPVSYPDFINIKNKTATFGLYPQTYVKDQQTVLGLQMVAQPESNGWYKYHDEYYAKATANPSFDDLLFSDRSKVEKGKEYWFKCEPISWKLLSTNNNECYLLSEVLLDAQPFNDFVGLRTIDGKDVRANNYEHSDLRNWLNNDFYNTAFQSDRDYIKKVSVDNSVKTTNSENNEFICNNTEDYVFLPSYVDYNNADYGFKNDTSRQAQVTDWAVAHGITYYTNRYGAYFTRSPDYQVDYRVSYVQYTGTVDSFVTNSTDSGVRPGIILKF